MPKTNPEKNTKNASSFKKSVNAVTSRPKIFFYTLLLDIGFIAVFLLLNYLINLLIPSDPAFITHLQQNTLLFIGVILLLIVYFLVAVVAYSFFSLIILGNIKSYSAPHEHDFSMFKKMFALNLLLFAVFFILLVIFNLILGLLVNVSTWIEVFVTVLIVLIAFIVYTFYNLTHSAFIMNHEISESLKHSFKHLFTRAYLGVFMFSLGVLVAYIVVYFVSGLLFKDFILQNYEAFVNVSSVVTIIIVYLLFYFNRIYFFFVAEKHIGHKE